MDVASPLQNKDNRAWHLAIARIASDLSKTDVQNCLLLTAIPVAMSIVNSNWLFTPLGYLDPWCNVAYFLHYSDPTFWNSYYKIARLSWIIPGFIAYHIFQPVLANYLLHMGCLVASIIFFYLAVARVFGRSVAFASAACFAVFVPFHGSGGWDYQNAPAGAYYIICFYLLTRAAGLANKRAPLIGAGAAYAAAIHATISFVNMAPILAAHFIVLSRSQSARRQTWRDLVASGLWFVLGAVILTVALGVVNRMIGRDFLFFKILLGIVISRVHDSSGQAAWWLPWSSGWYLQEPNFHYVSVIISVLIGCVCSMLLASLRRRIDWISFAFQAEYVFVSAVWIAWQSAGQTALEPDYFAYPLYPVMFFALAGMMAMGRAREREERNVLLYGLISLIVIIPLCFPWLSVTLYSLFQAHVVRALAVLALLVVALFAFSRARPAGLVAAVFAFATMNGFGAAATGQPTVDQPTLKVYQYNYKCEDREGAFAALVSANLYLNRFVSRPDDIFVWWNKDEVFKNAQGCEMKASDFSLSMASFGLQYIASPWQGMPRAGKLSAKSISLLGAKDAIVVPTANYKNVESLIHRFGSSGILLEIRGRTIVKTSLFNFDLYVLGIQHVRSGMRIDVQRNAWKALPGNTLAATANEADLTTVAEQRAYAAAAPFLLLARNQGKLGDVTIDSIIVMRQHSPPTPQQ